MAKHMQCAQCGVITEQMEMCDFCRRPVCCACRIEDDAGNISPLQAPEIRHAMCVGYWTPARSRGSEWRRAQQKGGR
jgi:hypothetical protein